MLIIIVIIINSSVSCVHRFMLQCSMLTCFDMFYFCYACVFSIIHSLTKHEMFEG